MYGFKVLAALKVSLLAEHVHPGCSSLLATDLFYSSAAWSIKCASRCVCVHIFSEKKKKIGIRRSKKSPVLALDHCPSWPSPQVGAIPVHMLPWFQFAFSKRPNTLPSRAASAIMSCTQLSSPPSCWAVPLLYIWICDHFSVSLLFATEILIILCFSEWFSDLMSTEYLFEEWVIFLQLELCFSVSSSPQIKVGHSDF